MPSQPPDPYSRQFDFTNHEQTQPTKPLPGSKVDLELNEVRESLNATIDRLNIIQRDDGLIREELINEALISAINLTTVQRQMAEAARNDTYDARNEVLAAEVHVVSVANGAVATTSSNVLAAQAAASSAQSQAASVAANASQAAASAASALSSANTATEKANLADVSASAAAQSAVDAEAAAQAAEDAVNSFNPGAFIPQPAVAPVDGQILSYDGTAWVAQDNYAQVLKESVRNETGSTLPAGSVVYISGAAGNKPLVAKAQANSESASSKTFAVLSAAIANNNNGDAVTSGLIKGLNLSSYAAGAALWLSPAVAGGFTSTKPSAPDHAVLIGWVVRSHANQGELLVKIQNGYELAELHNVSAASPSDGQVLKFESSTGLWKPASPNPFDQSLNTTNDVSFNSIMLTPVGSMGISTSGSFSTGLDSTSLYFSSLQLTEATGLLMPTAGQKIVFPDATEQTTAAPPAVDIQTFGGPSSSGTFTWTKPAGAKMVQVRMWGGGSGGTGGSCEVVANARNGGGGGGGGAHSFFFIPADSLPATVTVGVGAGGNGGAGRSTVGTGQSGFAGGTSSFGNYRAIGGLAPVGATAGGVGSIGTLFQIANAGSGANGGAGGATNGSNGGGFTAGQFLATGGGGGGGFSANNTGPTNGGNGGGRVSNITPASYNVTLAGGQGGAGATLTPATNGVDQDTAFASGSGGGGGYYSTGFAGGNGGAGGWPAGGGGGGGASDSGFLSGNGGKGGNGFVHITTYF